MDLSASTYVPTLAVRASEMNGLEQLPGLTKDRLRPMFLLAPWTTANTLTKAVERIQKAFPNRQYFLDIDRDYAATNQESDAQRELRDLQDPNNSYANWRFFTSKFPLVQPCIQLIGQTQRDFITQIRFAQIQERTFCVRIEKSRFPTHNFDEIIGALNEVGTADYAIMLEGGWTNDPLTLAAWFTGLITDGLRQIDANVPIIISCTSMPKVFTDIEIHKAVPFSNRELVQQISTQTNRNVVLYGDWGSTRPREQQGGGQRPVDRIDYPTQNSWFIARNKEREWTFKEAAEEVVSQSKIWDGKLNIWGENMILQTAANPAFAINSPQKNVAARVNIHLHRQAFYGNTELSNLDFDEDWED
jgi:hypothetical protein